MGRREPIRSYWFYLIFRGCESSGSGMQKDETARLGGLGWANQGSLDRYGETDELGEGVTAEVGDPEIAARVDGEGEGLEKIGIGAPADRWGKGRARIAGGGSG